VNGGGGAVEAPLLVHERVVDRVRVLNEEFAVAHAATAASRRVQVGHQPVAGSRRSTGCAHSEHHSGARGCSRRCLRLRHVALCDLACRRLPMSGSPQPSQRRELTRLPVQGLGEDQPRIVEASHGERARDREYCAGDDRVACHADGAVAGESNGGG
jgi:hypothetical protein